jgi:hypothetical protein
MNLRAQQPRKARARQRLGLLVLCLSPAAALFAPNLTAETRSVFLSRPYLAVIDPPGLRFAEALPPPDLSVLPPAGAPPRPVATPEPVVSPALPPEANTPVPDDSTVPSPVPAKPAAGRPAATEPPPILPDDTRAKVRPEDFLPFFQFPANAAQADGVTVVVPATLTPPAPGSQPPSSATYRQQ